VEITLLGTGTSIPHPDRASSGCLVRAGGTVMLFDVGSGTLKRLAEAGHSYLEIDLVFLTHFHPDHTGDLVPLLFALRNPYFPRTGSLQIVGPPGLLDFYRGLCGVYGTHVEALDYDLKIAEMEGPFEATSFSVMSVNVPHTRQSLAYRVEAEGRSFVVSGDTGPSPELVEFSRGADLALFECSFTVEQEAEGHLTPVTAGGMAEEAGVSKLVLTHFYPVFGGCDIVSDCRKVFSGEVTVGTDLMRILL